jgi:hypothetical protein
MYAKLPSVASNAVSDGSLFALGRALRRSFEIPKSKMRVRSSGSPAAICFAVSWRRST